MLLESLKPLRVRLPSGEVRLDPGRPVHFTEADGLKLLEKAPDTIRRVTPEPPIRSGWLVSYRDTQWRLRGGCDERQAGTVEVCSWREGAWQIVLTNGQTVPLNRILSVGQTDGDGRVLSAWLVRDCGLDGRGSDARTDISDPPPTG